MGRRPVDHGRRTPLRPAVVALATAWVALVVGLSLVAAHVAGRADGRDDGCAISLRSRGFDACAVPR